MSQPVGIPSNAQLLPGGSSPPGPVPALLGLKAWSFDFAQANQALGLTAGVFVAILVRPGPILCTNLGLWSTGAATAPSTGVNKLGLYTEAGVKIDETGDMSASFATVGYVEGALSAGPRQLAADTNYWQTALAHMTADGTIAGLLTGAIGNYPVFEGSHRPGIFIAAQATQPANFNPATASMNSGSYFFGMS